MNINAKKGDKVILTYPYGGYPADQVAVKEYLKTGKTYTIEKTEVGAWSTKVWLKERPGKEFNSVHFEDYKENDHD